jgi:outer membrane protein assembly factor BamB
MFYCISCRKSTEPIGNEKPPPGYQQDIPWPSLAESPWPMSHHDPQSTGRSSINGPVTNTIYWEYADNMDLYTGVAIGPDSTIYFVQSTSNEGFIALRPNGQVKWKLDLATDHKVPTTPIVTSGGTIFFYNGDRKVYAVDPNGSIKREFEIEYPTHNETFNIDLDGTLYFVGYDQTLYAYSQDGNLLWGLFDERFYNQGGTIRVSFSTDGRTLYIPGFPITLLAVDIESRQVKWTYGENMITQAAMVDSDDNIYILTENRLSIGPGINLISLNSNGEQRWEFNAGEQMARDNIPTIDKHGNLYFAADSMYSLDYNGKLRWEISLSDYCDSPLVCDLDGNIYVGLNGISILGFNSIGTMLWRIDEYQPFVGGSPAIGYESELIFPSAGSRVKLYSIK